MTEEEILARAIRACNNAGLRNHLHAAGVLAARRALSELSLAAPVGPDEDAARAVISAETWAEYEHPRLIQAQAERIALAAFKAGKAAQ